jgi:hypothetical protein
MQALVTHNRNSYSVAIEFRRSVAFDKILPSDVNLRRIERNSFYKSIDYNCCYEAPIAKSIAPEESGSAYQSCMKMADADRPTVFDSDSLANVLGYIDCRRDGLSVVGKMTLEPPAYPFRNAPDSCRAIGRILATPILGGLHHQYVRI